MKRYFWLLLLISIPFSLWSENLPPKQKSTEGHPELSDHTEGSPELSDHTELKQSVVLVQSYQQNYDWLIPWNKKKLKKYNGSALVLPNQYLLTTADLVANQTLIEVRKPLEEQSYEAKVALMDYTANLALLQVTAPEFWTGLLPIEWGTPETGKATIQQWENRYEWKSIPVNIKTLLIGYRNTSRFYFPMMEGIATLKRRSSGNPVVKDGKVIGMTLQKRNSGVDIFPSMFLQSFLEKTTRKPYHGIPQRGFAWHILPQNSVRKYLKIEKQYTGILITRVLNQGTGSEVLKLNDFLISIANWNISNEGQIEHPEWGKVLFDFLFTTTLKINKLIVLEVIRDGKLQTLETQLSHSSPNQYSVPLRMVNKAPKYVLQGGLLFQELNINYLELWGKEWRKKAPTRLSMYQQLESHLSKNKNRRLVFLSRILPASINIGYQNLIYQIVTEINGKAIHRLEDVALAFKNPQNGFHKVHFLPGGNRAYLILPDEGLERANQQILNNYQIPQLQNL